jgi:hypothetical protein
MTERSEGLLEFLGARADPGLLRADRALLPPHEEPPAPIPAGRGHERLVAVGSALTGASLLIGSALALFAAWRLLFHGGGALDAVVGAVGALLVATHWGWVHVAEYAGVTLDEHREHTESHRGGAWLEGLEPYPRFSVSTGVSSDASIRVERVLHRPVLTPGGTFTFTREAETRRTFDAHAPASEVAAAVEDLRRETSAETERTRGLWEAAAGAYEAQLWDQEGEEDRLAARRAAATALSEHLNATLREPPLTE